MRVLLDTNVLLDSLLQRAPWHGESDAILQAADRGEVVCALTTLSIANLFYIGRRFVGTAQARTDIRACLNRFDILPISRQTLLDADGLTGNDFEDNIHIAAAVAAGVDAVVTRDPNGFTHCPVPVWSPAELLRRLVPPPP
jgi:predicted nucleic acid-binding protein